MALLRRRSVINALPGLWCLASLAGCSTSAKDADASIRTGTETLLLKMETLDSVHGNPTFKTTLTVASPAHITKIMTYHFNDGAGQAPGTIGLKSAATGAMVGRWEAIGLLQGPDTTPGAAWPTASYGPPYLYWATQPRVDIPAGTYEVIDSSLATWSTNKEVGNRGIAWIWGFTLGGNPDAAADAPHPAAEAGGDSPGPAIDGNVAADAPRSSVDAPALDGPPLAGTLVAPSPTAQVLPAGGGVSVTVPGGLLATPQVLSVTPIANPPAFNLGYMELRSAYEVTLGALHDLGVQELVVSFPYAASAAESPLDDYVGAYYDESAQAWLVLPTTIDTVGRRVYVHTPHLSKIAFGAVKEVQHGVSSLKNDVFVLHYKYIEANAEYPPSKVDGGVLSGYTIDPAVPASPGVHRYVSDVWHALNEAYAVYRSPANDFPDLRHGQTEEVGPDGTVVTTWTRQHVFLDASVSTAQVSKLSGAMMLPYLSTSYAQLRHTVAHELFHCIQRRSFFTSSFTTGKWWIESTADMAAGRLVGQEPVFGTTPLMGGDSPAKRIYWLHSALDFASTVLVTQEPYDEHEYTTALFLAYLELKRKVGFPELYKAQAGYYTGTFIGNLKTYLAGRGLDLGTVYQEYAELFLFDKESPIRGQLVGSNALLAIAQNADKNTTLAAGASKTDTFALNAYSTRLLRIPVDMPAGSASRNLIVRVSSSAVLGTGATSMSVKLFGAQGGLVEGVRKLGEVKGGSGELKLQAGPGDVLFAVVSTGEIASAGSVTIVDDTSAPAISGSITITPPAGFTGVVTSYSYVTFKATLSITGTDNKMINWSEKMVSSTSPGTSTSSKVDWNADAKGGVYLFSAPACGSGCVAEYDLAAYSQEAPTIRSSPIRITVKL